MTKSSLKVAIVTISLSKGGAERSTALLSKMLFSKGVDVHLISLTDAVDYDYSGTLFNLGLYKSEKDTLLHQLHHLRRLKSYLNKHQFDFIIDNRTRGVALKEYIYLNYIYSHQRVIYVARSFHLENYFPKSNWITQKMIQKTVKIVGVSKTIATAINTKYNTTKAVNIYNPLPGFPAAATVSAEKPYILFLGRIEEAVKNLTLLLDGYQHSKLPDKSIGLKIYGDGKDKDWLVKKIDSVGLKSLVTVHHFTTDIYPVLKNALFLALTSRYEGFPRVLLESLSVGTPVISVDCKSGPDEIILHEQNGLLIENFNPTALADAMNRLIFDETLYKNLKENAIESVSHLNQENIAMQWLNLLEDAKSKD